MATFLTRREAKERAAHDREQTRSEKRYYNDLKWLAKREVLNDKEIYDLYKLSEKYSNLGPRQLEYELGELMRLQEYFKRHSGKSEDPHLNALQKHLFDHNARLEAEKKEKGKKLVYAHPTEKLAAKNK